MEPFRHPFFAFSNHSVEYPDLLRRAFFGDPEAIDPDVVVAAWLIVLPRGLDPPSAARRLVRTLRRSVPGMPTARQRRIRELLNHVAGHPRRKAPADRFDQNF